MTANWVLPPVPNHPAVPATVTATLLRRNGRPVVDAEHSLPAHPSPLSRIWSCSDVTSSVALWLRPAPLLAPHRMRAIMTITRDGRNGRRSCTRLAVVERAERRLLPEEIRTMTRAMPAEKGLLTELESREVCFCVIDLFVRESNSSLFFLICRRQWILHIPS